jgi:LysR family hydrogen peroxide-inducible transcriptional activator
LRDLEYALAVEQHQHFGKAAEAVRVSQPTLSEQIRKLEDQLGIVLFERTNRTVVPSIKSQAVLRQMEVVLVETQRLLDVAKHAGEPFSSILRVGAIATLGPYYFPYLLKKTHKQFPSLALRLTEGRTAELLQSLRRGDLDCVLVAMPIEGSGLAWQQLFFEPFFLVCPVGHPLAAKGAGEQPLSLSRLKTSGLLLLEEGHCLREHALSLCRGPAPVAQRHATGLETLWHMIAAGEGYSLLPSLSLQHRQMTDRLVSVREIEEPDAGRTIALVWRASDPRSREFGVFADFLQGNAPLAVRTNVSPEKNAEEKVKGKKRGVKRVR